MRFDFRPLGGQVFLLDTDLRPLGTDFGHLVSIVGLLDVEPLRFVFFASESPGKVLRS